MLNMNTLSIKSLIQGVGSSFERDLAIYNKSREGSSPTKDFAMSCLAIFYFKWPSLLTYEVQKSHKHIQDNLKNLFDLEKAPSDTQIRERLDEVEPSKLRAPFKTIFSMLQRNKVLEEYVFMGEYYLASVDGTGLFSSQNVHCENCCVKNHKNETKTYYHQMLGISIVHPNKKQVIPLAPEFNSKQDGHDKNDCERSAAKRLLADTRREHPHLKLIIVEDALAANAPHIIPFPTTKYAINNCQLS